MSRRMTCPHCAGTSARIEITLTTVVPLTAKIEVDRRGCRAIKRARCADCGHNLRELVRLNTRA